jgi:hypothetical protein
VHSSRHVNTGGVALLHEARPEPCTLLLALPLLPHHTHAQVAFSAGQLVWSERDALSSQFYIIRDGAASLKDASTGAVLSKLGPGKYFGQQSLVGSGACVFVLCAPAWDGFPGRLLSTSPTTTP